MEHQLCCSVCRKCLDGSDTVYGTGCKKKQMKMCSWSCERHLQYFLGFAHGVIIFEVLSKLCSDVFHSGMGKHQTVPASSIRDVTIKKNGICRNLTSGAFTSTKIKREANDGGHSEDDFTDLKVFFDGDTESEQMVTGLDRGSTCLTRGVRAHTAPHRRQTAGLVQAESVCRLSKRTRTACSTRSEAEIARTPWKGTQTADFMQSEHVHPPSKRMQPTGGMLSESACTFSKKRTLTAGLPRVENTLTPLKRAQAGSTPADARDSELVSPQESRVLCKFCSRVFPSGAHQALAEHLCQVHTKDIELSCNICGVIFKERKLLRRHKKNVHGKTDAEGIAAAPKKFECDKCGKDFSANDYLQEHRRRSHSIFKQAPVDCDVCGESFRNKIQLNRHMTSKHEPQGGEGEKKEFWCERCNKQYPTRVRLQRHNQFVHSKQLAVDCNFCGKNFRNKLLLKHHIQFMHSKQTPGDCKVCGKTYRNVHLLKMHLKVVHKVKDISESNQEPLLQCIFCTEAFPPRSNDHILNHLFEFHAKEISPARDLSCDICGAKFKRKVYLSRHKKKIHSLGAVAMTKNNTEHRSKKEREKKRYPCDKCGKTYTQSALSQHIRIYHTTQEPVDCDLCGKTLLNMFHLEQHKRQHVPTKICDICGASFKTDAGLRGHLAAHKGTKSHVCEICGIGFVRKTSWQRHVKLHSDQTVSFQCDSCPKTFTTLYSLNTHELSKHHRGMFFNNRLKTLENVGYYVDKEAITRHLDRQCVACGEHLVDGTCPAHPEECMLLFKCSYCELVVNHVDDLCQHLKKHSLPLAFTASTRNYTVASSGKRDDSDVDYTCKVCHKSFQRRENLVGHMKQHKEKTFACHICFKKFTYKCNMQNHLRTHSDDKPFQCEVCQKAFKCKQLRNNHRLIHNLSESPFKCQICGKGLTRKFFLQRHYRQMHPGVKV